jgi:hypothetical protein
MFTCSRRLASTDDSSYSTVVSYQVGRHARHVQAAGTEFSMPHDIYGATLCQFIEDDRDAINA